MTKKRDGEESDGNERGLMINERMDVGRGREQDVRILHPTG